MISFISINRAKILFSLMLTLMLINSARYLFKFGASSSSPGYVDTPITFWIFRYVLVGLILILFLNDWKRFRFIDLAGFGVLALSAVYAASTANSSLIQIASFHLCLAGLTFTLIRAAGADAAINYVRHLTTLLYVLAICFALFLFLQGVLYIFFDVLPSHSHRGSIIIRFGSLLDDSLAFGILLPMFAGLLFYGIKDEFFRILSVFSVILLSVVTGSLTAMFTTAMYSIWLQKQEWRRFSAWIALLALFVFSFHWYFAELWLAKAGSIAGHLEGLEVLAGDRNGGFAESGWILLFKNFGIPAVFVMMCFHLYVQLVCVRLSSSVGANSQYVGAVEGLNFSAFLASFNLPVLMIFPVYFFLAVLAAVMIGFSEKVPGRLDNE